jgi:septal ring factor EnvC (AmiA/AmiB activator)
MQKKIKTIISLVLLVLLMILQGCSSAARQEKVAINPDIAELYNNESVGNRFQQRDGSSRSSVDSAIELSEKYASLSADAALMSRQNQELTSKNKQLEEQVASMDNKLQQAQKELKEANRMLVDMRAELTNWKSQVLGFRDEMRSAETAQLEALLKILKALGGEVTSMTAKGN